MELVGKQYSASVAPQEYGVLTPRVKGFKQSAKNVYRNMTKEPEIIVKM